MAPVEPVPQAMIRPSGPAFTARLMAASASWRRCVVVRPVVSSSVWLLA